MRARKYRLAHMPDGIHAFTSWGPVLGPFENTAEADRAIATLADSHHWRKVQRAPDCSVTTCEYAIVPAAMPGYPEPGAQAMLSGGTIQVRPGLPSSARVVQVRLDDWQKYQGVMQAAAV